MLARIKEDRERHSQVKEIQKEGSWKMKKTRHEGDESTVAFWLYMKALYKDEQ
jgi:hypothetical protein